MQPPQAVNNTARKTLADPLAENVGLTRRLSAPKLGEQYAEVDENPFKKQINNHEIKINADIFNAIWAGEDSHLHVGACWEPLGINSS
jgi:hypothetical protein